MLIQKLNRNEKIQLSKYILAVWLATLFLKTINYIANDGSLIFDNSFSFGNFSEYLFHSIGVAIFIWYVVHRIIKT
jgi:hypothetical protein